MAGDGIAPLFETKHHKWALQRAAGQLPDFESCRMLRKIFVMLVCCPYARWILSHATCALIPALTILSTLSQKGLQNEYTLFMKPLSCVLKEEAGLLSPVPIVHSVHKSWRVLG
jgi:hypothetical protein